MTIACHAIEIMPAARRHVVAGALGSSVASRTKSFAVGCRTQCDFDVRPLAWGGNQGPKGVRTGRWKG